MDDKGRCYYFDFLTWLSVGIGCLIRVEKECKWSEPWYIGTGIGTVNNGNERAKENDRIDWKGNHSCGGG